MKAATAGLIRLPAHPATLPPGLGHSIEHGISGQGEDITAIHFYRKIKGFRRAIVTVAAHENCYVRPELANAPDHRAHVGGVPKPGDGRLAGQIRAAFQRPLAGDHEGRIAPQGIEVVCVFIAGRDRHHTGGDHVAVSVRDKHRVARIRQMPGDHVGSRKRRAASLSTISPPFDDRLPAS